MGLHYSMCPYQQITCNDVQYSQRLLSLSNCGKQNWIFDTTKLSWLALSIGNFFPNPLILALVFVLGMWELVQCRIICNFLEEDLILLFWKSQIHDVAIPPWRIVNDCDYIHPPIVRPFGANDWSSVTRSKNSYSKTRELILNDWSIAILTIKRAL